MVYYILHNGTGLTYSRATRKKPGMLVHYGSFYKDERSAKLAIARLKGNLWLRDGRHVKANKSDMSVVSLESLLKINKIK